AAPPAGACLRPPRCVRARRACTRDHGRGTRTVPTARRARPTRAGTPAGRRRRRPPASRTPTRASRGRRAPRARRGRPCGRAPARGSRRATGGPTRCRSPGAGFGPVAERPEEAAALTGVARALPFLLDDEEEHVAVAVVVGAAEPLAVARGVA